MCARNTLPLALQCTGRREPTEMRGPIGPGAVGDLDRDRLALVQHGRVRRLAGGCSDLLHEPPREPRKVVLVQRREAEHARPRPQPESPWPVGGLDVALRLQRGQVAVERAALEAELTCQRRVRDAAAGGGGGERIEDRQSAEQGLQRGAAALAVGGVGRPILHGAAVWPAASRIRKQAFQHVRRIAAVPSRHARRRLHAARRRPDDAVPVASTEGRCRCARKSWFRRTPRCA